MRFFLLALLAMPVFGEAGPDDINKRAQELLRRAYMREDVSRFCIANPDAVYPVEIGGVQIALRCSAWHDWHNLQGRRPD